MTEREQFEQWAQEARLNIAKIEIGYLYSSTEDAWMGWQAARATPALPPALPQGVEEWIEAQECKVLALHDEDGFMFSAIKVADVEAFLSGMAIVPVDAIPAALPMEPFQTIDMGSKNYKAGWNACRLAMLAAAKEKNDGL